MDNRQTRHEFRFVIDGVELDDRQQERIALAVQKAAFESLSSADVPLDGPVFVGHNNFRLPPEWLGMVLLNGQSALDIGDLLQGFGPLTR